MKFNAVYKKRVLETRKSSGKLTETFFDNFKYFIVGTVFCFMLENEVSSADNKLVLYIVLSFWNYFLSIFYLMNENFSRNIENQCSIIINYKQTMIHPSETMLHNIAKLI